MQTRVSPICSQRVLDVSEIDNDVPLGGICTFLRLFSPEKRFEQCDDVVKDEKPGPGKLKSTQDYKQEKEHEHTKKLVGMGLAKISSILQLDFG